MDAFEILGGPNLRGRGRPRIREPTNNNNRPVGRPKMYGDLSLQERMRLAQKKFQDKKKEQKKKETLRLQDLKIKEEQAKIINREQSKQLQKQQQTIKRNQKNINKQRQQQYTISIYPEYVDTETIRKSSGNTYINHYWDASQIQNLSKISIALGEQEALKYIYQQYQQYKNNNNYYFRFFIEYQIGPQNNKKTITLSTQYVSYKTVLKDMKRIINETYMQYNTQNIGKMTTVIFTVLIPNERAGASSHKSVNQANKIWYSFNKPTRTNCLYTSLYLAMHPDMIEKYMDDPKTINEPSKKLKKHINPEKKEYSTGEELKKSSNYLKRPIILYNNIYQKLEEYHPENNSIDKRKRPTRIKNTLEIQIKDNHYIALIRKTDINITNEKYIDKLESKEVRLEKFNEKCKRITKFRKYEELNTKIATWDIETFCNDDRTIQCYAVGFAMYKDDQEYYKDFWGLDAQFQFFEFLYYNREILNEYTLYAHNGGKFDLMNALKEYLLQSDKWKIDNNIELNGSFIKLNIKSPDGYVINFLDSAKMLVGTLEKLTKDFKVEHQKLIETVNHNDINENNYNDIPELKPYLKNDCLGLLEVMTSFNQTVFDMTYVNETKYNKKKNDWVHNQGGLNMTNFLTGATLSKQYYWNRHYEHYKYPIYTNTDEIDSFIRKSYYGGRVEMSQLGLVEKKLYYLDYTSLYPACGTYDLPYGEPEYIKFNNSSILPDSFFGFIKCLVKTKCNKRRPIHGDKSLNKLCFREHQKWEEMTLFSEEVRYGIEKDMYDYQFIEGYQYLKAPIMKEVFTECFEKKATSKDEGKPAMAQAWKIILNSLYGFWGLRTKDRDSVKIYPKGDSPVFNYLQSGKLLNESDVGNYTILRVLNDLEITDFNVGIASAISSYGRIRLINLIHDIEDMNYKVYMNDTDSIITDCNISKYDDLMQNYMWDGCGDELGSLKNEADELIEKSIKNKDKNIDKVADYLPIELSIVYEYADNDTKDKLKKLALSEIAKKEGGLIAFDRAIFYGCKFYGLQKLFNDKYIDITKCKGYKQTKGKDELTFNDMLKLIDKTKSKDDNDFGYFDMYNKSLEQKQIQFRIPKCNMLSETQPFRYTIPSITKQFKQIYTKGNVDSNGVITPLINM
jgi:hypothetical protein